jgi:O-antigen ligase
MVAMLFVPFMTGSKGPALAMLVVGSVWAARRGEVTRLIAISAVIVALLRFVETNPLLDRVAGAAEDLSTLERIVLIDDGLQQIAGSPWIGSASVEFNSGFYVHNVFLEAAMALGIPLTLVFLALIANGLLLAWRLLASQNDLVGLLFMQGLIAAGTSDSMYSSGLMWIGLLLTWQVSRRRSSEVAGTVLAARTPLNPARTEVST